MVQIAAPEGWQPPVANDDATPDPTTRAPVKKPAGTPELPETAARPFEDFDDIDSLLTGETQPPGSKHGRMEFKSGVPGKAAVHPAPGTHAVRTQSGPTRPPTSWVDSGSSAQRKKFAMQVGAIVTLVAVAIGLVVILTNTLFKPVSNSLAIENQNEKDSSGKTGNDSKASTVSAGAEGKDSSQPTPESANRRTADSNANAGSPPNTEVANMIPPALGIPDMDLAGETPAPNAPLGMDPGGSSSSTTRANELIEQFGELNELLAGGESQLALQELADATGADRGQIGIGTVFVRKPPAIDVDVEGRLRQPIVKIAFQDVSLVDAVRTLSELSTIPICYEVDVIDIEGIKLSQRIQLEQTETTVGQVLDGLLQSRGLKAVAQPGVLLITAADRDQWSNRTFRLDELHPDDPSIATRFSDFVQHSIARGTWKDAGGEGTIDINGLSLQVHQTGPVLTLIGQLIDKLVAARSLATDPGNETARSLLRSRHVRSQPARQAGITLTLAHDRRLEQVLSTIAAESGTVVLVNWQALLPDGWTPQTEIPWASQGVPLETKLRELAESMGLSLRAINEDTLQLTTNADARRQLELEIYPCADLLQKYSPEQLTKLFEGVLGTQVDAGSGMSATLESTCQCWVAILPHKLHIQFEAGLNQLRKEIAAASK